MASDTAPHRTTIDSVLAVPALFPRDAGVGLRALSRRRSPRARARGAEP
jgi:hypothetical protein